MRRALFSVVCLVVLAVVALPSAQDRGSLAVSKSVEAGKPFSISTSGSGKAVLYLVGPQVLRREVELGKTVELSAGEVHRAGHYVAALVGSGVNAKGEFDVTPARQPASLIFLAKPSRLAVGQRQGISGVVFVLDGFKNLILEPLPVSFELVAPSGGAQARSVTTNYGVAWVKMDSATRAGTVQFDASSGSATAKRVIQQVPGEPCRLKMSARPMGERIVLQTEPVRDCNGNPVPDGTIVTFTENYGGKMATVDVPLKRGVAQAEMPAYQGAVISAATGVVLGNEIRWH